MNADSVKARLRNFAIETDHTLDVDLLARRISNSSVEMREVFREIFI